MLILPINEVQKEYYSNFKVENDDEKLGSFELFLKDRAMDFNDKLFASTYLYIENDIVKGYVSICTGSVRTDYIKESLGTSIPNSHQFPAILIAKMAVDKNYRHLSVGTKLYAYALNIAFEVVEKIGARFLIVHAIKKQETLKFYEKMGFINVRENTGNTITMVVDIFELLNRIS